ncbi:MAG: hypothetical protein WC974_09170 [Thermoplasmata archaeon]
MDANLVLHEQRLENIEKSLKELLERSNDFTVKVINGTTKERLASELIGEMYVNMKGLQKQTPKNIWYGFGNNIMPLLNILTIIALIITMIQVFK